MVRLLLVINPAAGNGMGIRRGKAAAEELSRRGLAVEPVVSEYPGHIVELLSVRACHMYDAVIGVGGDGTIYEMINGVLGNQNPVPPIGVVPAGTGNSLAQDLGARDLQSALGVITGRKSRRIDVGRYKVNGDWHYFANVLGIGFVAAVARRALRLRRLGHASYALSVFLELARMQPYELQLTVDGETVECQNHFVEVCNSRYTAGNMLIAPQAVLDDGLLDLVLLNDISRAGVVRSFPSVYSGTHLSNPHVEVFRGRRFQVRANPPQPLTPDGEVVGETPLTVEVVPSALEVLCR